MHTAARFIQVQGLISAANCILGSCILFPDFLWSLETVILKSCALFTDSRLKGPVFLGTNRNIYTFFLSCWLLFSFRLSSLKGAAGDSHSSSCTEKCLQ